jgi:ribonuclease HII
MPCSLVHEDRLRARGIHPVAGIDEAGRGALAGPVVAAAVILPEGFTHARLDDSKRLSPKVRAALYEELTADPRILWAVAGREPAEIDRINILRATHAAMRDAAEALSRPPAHVLIDGPPVEPFPFPQLALVGGDGLSFSVAAASVLAKVTRDRILERLDGEYPGYGFAVHKGYATRLHLDSIRSRGASPVHRRSFAPVAQGDLGL